MTTAARPSKKKQTAKPARSASNKPRPATKRKVERRQREFDGDVPEYDAKSVGRVAARVQILNVELIHAHFERDDDGPLAAHGAVEFVPEIGIDFEWALDDALEQLGCLFRFAAFRDDEPDQPYRLFAHFRLLYSVSEPALLDDDEVHQFVAWNAMFNAWPYWREYLASTLNRAGLPRMTLPVLGVPRAVNDAEVDRIG
jgi:hypothetical protein